jgi:undecaprenyl-diphosphatase
MIYISLTGSAALLVPFNILFFVFLVKRQDRIYASFWACAVIGAALLNVLGKHVFERSRPDFWASVMPEASFSFPSGHAMQSMAVVAGLVTLAWQGRWKIQVLLIGIFYVFFVGFSRIYLGVHFPSDIIAGWMASLTWVFGLRILFGLSNKANVVS